MMRKSEKKKMLRNSYMQHEKSELQSKKRQDEENYYKYINLFEI